MSEMTGPDVFEVNGELVFSCAAGGKTVVAIGYCELCGMRFVECKVLYNCPPSYKYVGICLACVPIAEALHEKATAMDEETKAKIRSEWMQAKLDGRNNARKQRPE